jgi:hypothetical protein
MWIVAIAWIYVVGLMALTEPSVVAGMMTFLGYCVLPLSILYYLTGSRRRRARNSAARGTPGSGAATPLDASRGNDAPSGSRPD